MKMIAAVAGLSLAVLLNAPVHAESLQMNTVTCAQALELDSDTASVILIWLDGYLAGVTGDTKFDTEILSNFTTALRDACEKSPDAKLLEAAKIVGIE